MEANLTILLLACFALVGCAQGQSSICSDSCPGGVSVKGTCLKLFNMKKTWADAQAYCRARGSQLAVIQSNILQVAAENYLKNPAQMTTSFDGTVWIGARIQDPMALTGLHKRLWRWVADCSNCSLYDEMTLSAVTKQGCFNDWSSDREYESFQLGGQIVGDTCQKSCSDLGYRFAALAKNSLSSEPDYCFCGDNLGMRGGDSLWKCNDACKSDPSQACGGVNKNLVFNIGGNFANWDTVQPIATFLQCGVLNRLSPTSRVDTVSCSTKLKYFCGLPVSQCKYCPCGINEGDYFQRVITVGDWTSCVYLSHEQTDWFHARQVCVDRGGELLVLDSEEKHTAVMEELRKDNTDTSPVFIGLYRDNYYWDNAFGGAAMTYSNFADGFPRDESAECVNMNRNDDRKWETNSCSDEMAFMCENPIDYGSNDKWTNPSHSP